MKKIFAITFLFVLKITFTSGQLSKLELKKADHHLMHYYISLPGNWSPDKKWPVVISIEDASKQFKKKCRTVYGCKKRYALYYRGSLYYHEWSTGS